MLTHLLEGYIDSLQPGKIYGWAFDRANLPRRDLAAAGFGHGSYGYEFSFPLVLCDGVERTVSTRISDSNAALVANPMRMVLSLAEKVRDLGDPKPDFLEETGTIWNQHVADEARFWWTWLTTPEPCTVHDRVLRLHPKRELAENVKDFLQTSEGGTVRILDVGAGPLSAMGNHWPGEQVELISVDALAAQYTPMLNELGITPPTPTQYADAETLSSKFPPDTFDFTHCVNTLDCCANPLRAIAEMVKVTKPGDGISHHVPPPPGGEKAALRSSPVECFAGTRTPCHLELPELYRRHEPARRNRRPGTRPPRLRHGRFHAPPQSLMV